MSSEHIDLEPAAKVAIRAYLANIVGRWAALIGVVNGMFILSSLGYILFVIPRNAAAEAKTMAREEVGKLRAGAENEINQLTDGLRTQLYTLHEAYGEAKSEAKRTGAELDEVVSSIKELQTKALEVTKVSTEKAVKVLQEISKEDDATATLIRLAAAKETLESLENTTRSIETISRELSKLKTDLILGDQECLAKATQQIAEIRKEVSGPSNQPDWTLVNRASGKALEIKDGSIVPGAVQQMAPNGRNAQRWQLIRQP